MLISVFSFVHFFLFFIAVCIIVFTEIKLKINTLLFFSIYNILQKVLITKNTRQNIQQRQVLFVIKSFFLRMMIIILRDIWKMNFMRKRKKNFQVLLSRWRIMWFQKKLAKKHCYNIYMIFGMLFGEYFDEKYSKSAIMDSNSSL